MLERLFGLKAAGTSVRVEIVAGLTTFMTMAYIIFVNPVILSAGGLGPPKAATAAATCVAAAIPTIAMGLWSNYPFALASGMGLNAALAGLITAEGVPWQTAMGVVFIEGTIVAILVLTRVREAVMMAIPMELKRAIGVGIGLLIAFLGMQHAGWIVRPEGPEPLVTFGSFRAPATAVATLGLLITLVLMAWKVRGAILIGIFATTAVAALAGLAPKPPALLGTPDFSTFGRVDVIGALKYGLWPAIFAFMITDFFDTMGTVIGVGEQAGLLTPDGRLPRLRTVLLVDALAAVWGSISSASSVTTYVESAAGVGEGGRTGLTSVVVGILFLLSLVFTPLVSAVPEVGTAPALIVVGFLMMSVIRDIRFDNLEESFPAFLTMMVVPFTLSISRGVGYGFIAYTLIKLFRGKRHEVHPLMYIVSAVFAISFALT